MAFVPPARHLLRAKVGMEVRADVTLPDEDGRRLSGPGFRGRENGRYWARTSDLQLVELALSQLS